MPAFDTELAAYLIDPGRSEYDLDDLLAEQGARGRGRPTATATPCSRAAPPARCCCTRRSRARIAERELGPLLRRHRAAARAGAVRDGARGRRDRLGAHGGDRRARLRAGARRSRSGPHELAGAPFALGSPKQLGEVLFERLELPAGRRGKTGYSTDSKRARASCATCTRSCRSSRSGASSRSCSRPTCCRSPSCSATTAACTRRSRRSPPRPAGSRRSARTSRTSRSARRSAASCARRSSPRPGTRLLSVDYSQVELRILAHLSGEELLREAFARGDDIHAVTAAEVLGKERGELSKDERNRAKAVNFGIIYGISAHGLSEQLEISRDEAQAYIDTYRGRMPLRRRVHRARDRTTRASAATRSRCSAAAGRSPSCARRAGNVRSLGERLAVNTVIQGSAADIIKLAMVRIHRRLRDEGRAVAPRAADPRRAAARGARRRDDRRARSS